jgi:sulfur-carrier protein adenylyltransferase/sulfurtransferase
MLNDQEKQRYSRHLLMPNFGENGQLKLKNTSVLVIGCGGLGSPALLYLAAAGIGHIGMIEDDVIDVSNLQRQILFDEASLGQSKLRAAHQRLLALNSSLEYSLFEERINSQNALEIIKKFDIVLDASDNFPTRYLVNDACEILNKPFVYGAIHQFEGQLAVFNLNQSATYRDLFAEPPPPELAPNCAEAGVLGVLPGIIGAMQASEVIKIITGIGEPLVNKLFVIDTLTMISRTIKFNRNPARETIKTLIDYDDFCGLKPAINKLASMQEILDFKNQNIDYQLIDVRNETEYAIQNLEGINIPLAVLEENVEQISRSKKVIIHCQTGIRSQKAIMILTEKYGFTNLYNLEKPIF